MIRCIIVDDKPLAIGLLREYTGKVSFLQLVYATQRPLEALDYIREHPVDLVFLDIQMPELNGMSFLKLAGGAVRVILTTAYSEFALEGYEHDVVDYLLKPVSFDRFYKAVEKVRKVMGAVVLEDEGLFVKTEYRLQRVELAAIRYIEARQNYVSIVTTGGTIMSLQPIKSIEERLPVAGFMRVHKSYIVALSKIEAIGKGRIYIGDAVIPIGDSYREAFFIRVGVKG